MRSHHGRTTPHAPCRAGIRILHRRDPGNTADSLPDLSFPASNGLLSRSRPQPIPSTDRISCRFKRLNYTAGHFATLVHKHARALLTPRACRYRVHPAQAREQSCAMGALHIRCCGHATTPAWSRAVTFIAMSVRSFSGCWTLMFFFWAAISLPQAGHCLLIGPGDGTGRNRARGAVAARAISYVVRT